MRNIDAFDETFQSVHKTTKGIMGVGCMAVIVNFVIGVVITGLVIWGIIWGVGKVRTKGLRQIGQEIMNGTNQVEQVQNVSTN